MDAPKKI